MLKKFTIRKLNKIYLQIFAMALAYGTNDSIPNFVVIISFLVLSSKIFTSLYFDMNYKYIIYEIEIKIITK